MWICLNDAFLSIVSSNEPNVLKVRARRLNHLKRVFPKAKVHRDNMTDYRYRVFVSRDEVAEVLAKEVRQINYPNFKDSVKDKALHEMYLTWWSDHVELQDGDDR